MEKMVRVSVIGTGYVGLCTGIALGLLGNQVVCIGRNQEKIEKINKGIPPIHEEGLEDALKKLLAKGTFRATSDLRETLETEITFICVGTPPQEDGSIDLADMEKISEDLGRMLKGKEGYHTVVVKSTVVPGTTEKVAGLLEKSSGKIPGQDFGVCMNPEFLREGKALEDFLKPDRIVIGQLNEKSGKALHQLYKNSGCPILTTNLKTAEMIKYANNSFLATLISFSNEIANICELKKDVDVEAVLKGVILDKRISPEAKSPEITTYLKAGCGYGGSCLPKDVNAIINFSKQHGYNAKILEAANNINKERASRIVKRLEKETPLENKTVAVLGLAFKPGTDDMRYSPAIPIINYLLSKNVSVKAHDPVAMGSARSIFKERVTFHDSPGSALESADACLVITAWDQFKKIQEKDFQQCMKTPIILDCRRIYNPDDYRNIKYVGVGLDV